MLSFILILFYIFLIIHFFFISLISFILFFFFFNDTATTEIYTLSLHDALPISYLFTPSAKAVRPREPRPSHWPLTSDRKSTRLNSSHVAISYAVFCLKKKKKKKKQITTKKKSDK